MTGYTFITPEKLMEPSLVRLTTILNFFLSFIFAWILSEKSCEKTFVEKSKLPAIRSYRQTKTVQDNIEILIEKIDSYLKLDSEEVNYRYILDNIRDNLKSILSHTGNIKLDWGDVISDLTILNQLEDVDKQLKHFRKHQPEQKVKIQRLSEERDVLASRLPLNLRSETMFKFRNYDETGNKVYYMTGIPYGPVKYTLAVAVNQDFQADKLADELSTLIEDQPIGFGNIQIIKEDEEDPLTVIVTFGGDLGGNQEFVLDTIKEIPGIDNVDILSTENLDPQKR